MSRIFNYRNIPLQVLFLVIILFLLACEKQESEFRSTSLDIPIITGYIMFDNFANFQGEVGYPNENRGEYQSRYYLGFYPNPTEYRCNLHLRIPSRNSDVKLWITPAVYMVDVPSSQNYLGLTNMYAGGLPVFQIEVPGNDFSIDLTSLEDGYYRIYLKIDEVLLYANLVKYSPN